MNYPKHYEQTLLISEPLEKVFAFANNHNNLSSHMNKSSMMMCGSKMHIMADAGKGQNLGSHIQMKGSVLGVNLYLDEVITEYKPPYRKVWKTVGSPKLVVIGNYQLGFELTDMGNKSVFKVFIDYNLPSNGLKILGVIFGGIYAKWCVRQMIGSVAEQFNSK